MFRPWIKVVLAATVLAAVGAYFASGFLPRVFESEATLVVGRALTSANPTGEQFQTAQLLSASYVELAGERPILEEVMADVGVTDVTTEQFSKVVSVSASREVPFLRVTAQDGDPERAAAIANAMAEALVAVASTIGGPDSESARFVEEALRTTQARIESIQDEIGELVAQANLTPAEQQQLDTLETRLASLQTAYAGLLQFSQNTSVNQLTVTSSAVPPDGPASPRPMFNTLIAAVLALLLSSALVYGWTRLDDTVKTIADVERITGLPTLGSISRMPGERDREPMYRLAALLYPRSPGAEAFRTLRTNLDFTSVDQRLRSVVLTSSLSGEGKTVVSTNLAIVYAQSGRRTLLVDADLRRPGIPRILRLDNTAGLTNLLRHDDVDLDELLQTTEEPNLRVLTSGPIPPNPSELLNSNRMAEVMDMLGKICDVIVYDSPPIQAVTDAALLAARADATILVVHAGRTREPIVRNSRQALAKVAAHVVGVVLNQLPASAEVAYYGALAPDGPGQATADRDQPAAARAVTRPEAQRRIGGSK